MPTPTSHPMDRSTSTDATPDPLEGVDHIIVIDNGAHNIRIASIPYPFPSDLLSSTDSTIDPSALARNIAIDVFPNAIARTRTPHTIPASTSPTAPTPGSKTSIFVSSHIHTLLDDYAALHLRLPHQSGVIVDWAAQKQIWDHVFANHLAKLPGGAGRKGKLLQGKAVVVTETYVNLEPVQYAMDLLLFEQYGAQAVWRTTAAGLVGLGGGEVVRSQSPRASTVAADPKAEHASGSTPDETAPEHNDTPAEASTSKASPKRPARTPRASTSSTEPVPASIPRILPPPLPQAALILDLGYSYCHAIPIRHSQPHLPSIRRLELGGKMLINLLKETLSFQQLDMMDESWLMSHIFARTSFVAGSVGRRGAGNQAEVLERVWGKDAVEWSYEDLLALERYGRRRRGEKSVRVTWSLPDYGGGVKSGKERDRARYGYILDGPDPAPLHGSKLSDELDRKRPKLDPLSWESSFIAAASSTTTRPQPITTNADDEDDTQTLTLSTERFSIVETLFNPTSLSLDQQPLPLLVRDAISSLSNSTLPHARAAADMMWSNIILVGGLANVVGMKRRLENELRSLAPIDVGVRIWDARHADLVAVKSGVALACELSAKEAVRREAKGGGEGGRGKKKARKSRSGASMDEQEGGEGVGGRWLTYAQWMIAGGSEAEVVRAANAVFYPSVEG